MAYIFYDVFDIFALVTWTQGDHGGEYNLYHTEAEGHHDHHHLQTSISSPHKTSPTKNVEISINVSGKKGKRKKTQEDMLKCIKRAVNRLQKEIQMNKHKVHLLALISRGFFRNSVCSSPILKAICLSSAPFNIIPKSKNKWDVVDVTNIVKWFQGEVYSLKDQCTIAEQWDKFTPPAPLNMLVALSSRRFSNHGALSPTTVTFDPLSSFKVIITGVLGYFGARDNNTPNNCMLGTMLGFAVTSCVFSCGMIICYSFALSEWSKYLRNPSYDRPYYYYYHSKYSSQTARTSIGIGTVLLLLALTEFFVALASSIYGFINSCIPATSTSQQQMVYLQGQPAQFGQPGVIAGATTMQTYPNQASFIIQQPIGAPAPQGYPQGLAALIKELGKLRSEKSDLEERLQSMQKRNADQEERELEAIAHVRDSVQMVENAVLERDQVRCD
ncbi:predicted protein [Nematostella vectensis]|uniref:Uncharacterized protein n=1 Tax=Nematostella vectensis TaxID=45351 RepID=A7SYX2_NEMVE|nr:predicted protein [Nematostella vectensis]|eukprot:XP_001623194.1 predicted protein [Nematostella vectensis]